MMAHINLKEVCSFGDMAMHASHSDSYPSTRAYPETLGPQNDSHSARWAMTTSPSLQSCPPDNILQHLETAVGRLQAFYA